MGEIQSQAQLVQIINGITAGKYYQLSFFLTAVHDSDNAPVLISLEYLNANNNPIGMPVLQTRVEQFCLTDEVYTGFLEFTSHPASSQARYARLMLEINTANYPQGGVLVDDVTMIAVT